MGDGATARGEKPSESVLSGVKAGASSRPSASASATPAGGLVPKSVSSSVPSRSSSATVASSSSSAAASESAGSGSAGTPITAGKSSPKSSAKNGSSLAAVFTGSAADGAAAAAGVADRAISSRDCSHQRLRFEGLGHVTVRAGPARALLIESLEGTGEQQHGDVPELRIVLERLADLVAVLARHDDVSEDQVRPQLPGARHRIVPVADGHQHDVFVGEAEPDDLLDGDAVVGEEQGLRHGSPGWRRECGAGRPASRRSPYRLPRERH